MPLLKVWDAERVVKKLVVVPELTLSSAIEKVEAKLDCVVKKLVLEEDGTEVDDDEILKLVSENTFVALKEGESWRGRGNDINMKDSVPDAAVSVPDATVSVPDATVETSYFNLSATPSARTLPNGMPPPDKMPIPDLSPALHLALTTGRKTSLTFNQTLKESTVFYMAKYPDMKETSYYQSIGKKMIAKYPVLAYSEGTHTWSFFVSKLSQRLRSQRCINNTKSTRKIPAESESGFQETPPKALRFASPQETEITEEDAEKHIKELEKEWQGKQSVTHIRQLLKQMRTTRLSWQNGLPAGKIKPITQKYPCFEEGSFILHEFLCIKNEKAIDSYRMEIAEKMEKLLHHVKDRAEIESEDTEAVQGMALLQALEAAVARTRGKGAKSQSCFKMKQIDNPENISDNWLATKEAESPCLIIFLDKETNFLCSYVVGDDTKILTQAKSVVDSFIVLLATYYVFGLEYPVVYSQVMGIVQQFVFGDTFTHAKCTNWIKLADELTSVI